MINTENNNKISFFFNLQYFYYIKFKIYILYTLNENRFKIFIFYLKIRTLIFIFALLFIYQSDIYFFFNNLFSIFIGQTAYCMNSDNEYMADISGNSNSEMDTETETEQVSNFTEVFFLNNQNFYIIKNNLKNIGLDLTDILLMNKNAITFVEKFQDISKSILTQLNIEKSLVESYNKNLDIPKCIEILKKPILKNFISQEILNDNFQITFKDSERLAIYDVTTDTIDNLIKDFNFGHILENINNESLEEEIRNYTNLKDFISQEKNILINSNRIEVYTQFYDINDEPVTFSDNFEIIPISD